VDLRFNHQVRSPLPLAAVHFLRDGEALPDHFEYVPRSLDIGPFSFQTHRQDATGAHLAQGLSGHGIGEHAVDQKTAVNPHRQEHAWIGTTGADGIDERSGMKDHSFPGGKIRSRDRQRNSQIFKGFCLEKIVEKSDHPLVAGESAAGESPARKVPEAHPGGKLFTLRNAQSAAVGSADQGTHARAGNKTYRNIFFFEDFQHANMRNAPGKTTAQSQSYARTSFCQDGRRTSG